MLEICTILLTQFAEEKSFNVVTSYNEILLCCIGSVRFCVQQNIFPLIEKCTPLRQLQNCHVLLRTKATVLSLNMQQTMVGGRQINKNYDNLNAFYVHLKIPFVLLSDNSFHLQSNENCLFFRRGTKEGERTSQAHCCCFIMAVLLFIPEQMLPRRNEALI